jgi:hypothetical protein
MRKLFVLSIFYTVASCGNNRNEVMKSFLNQKKTAEDSLIIYKNSETYYRQLARQNYASDTILRNHYIDSVTMSWKNGRLTEERIRSLQLSIDSLQKMK